MGEESRRQMLIQFRADESVRRRAIVVAAAMTDDPNHPAHAFGQVTMSTALRLAVYRGLAALEAELGIAEDPPTSAR